MDAAITPIELKQRLAAFPPPTLVDVRRQPAFDEDRGKSSPARSGSLPEAVETWAAAIEPWRPVVVYCVRGHEVGQGACAALRARGLDARYRRGRPRAWRAEGNATNRSRRLPAGSRARGRRSTASRARGSSGASSIRRRNSSTCRMPRCARSPRPRARPRTTSRRSSTRTSGPNAASTRSSGARSRPPCPRRARRRSFVPPTRRRSISPRRRRACSPPRSGLSAMFADDHAMLKWGMLVYDSLYAWCRDAPTETHGWYPEKLAAGAKQ